MSTSSPLRPVVQLDRVARLGIDQLGVHEAARAQVHAALLLALAPERDADVADPHRLGHPGAPARLEHRAEGRLAAAGLAGHEHALDARPREIDVPLRRPFDQIGGVRGREHGGLGPEALDRQQQALGVPGAHRNVTEPDAVEGGERRARDEGPGVVRVQAAMHDVMRFWFERGVDGFRIDVLWHMVKAAGFPDNPPNPSYQPAMGDMHRLLQLHSTDQPEVHGIAADMRAIADSYGSKGRGERVLIGEIYLPVDRLLHYYGRERAEVHLPFNFQLVDAPWEARSLATLIANYEAALPPGRLAELGARQP